MFLKPQYEDCGCLPESIFQNILSQKFNELYRGEINLNKIFFLSNYLNIDLKIIQMFYRYPRMQNSKFLIKENIVFFFNFIKTILLTKKNQRHT